MATTSYRRNGKEASCEPCRKGRLKCDHLHPVCERCQRRGLSTQCYYHPAPLSRLRTEVSQNIFRPWSATPDHPAALPTPSIAAQTTIDIPGNSSTYCPPHYTSALQDSRLRTIADVLQHLRHFELFQKLLREYYAASQAALVPARLVLSAAASLSTIASTLMQENGEDRDATLLRYSKRILKSTSLPITITSDLDIQTFLELHTNDHLRLETIGLIYSISARACLLGLTRDDCKHDNIVAILYECSSTCLQLALEIAPRVTDMMLWLSYENLRLTTSIEGDSNPKVWRRLGELASDILALGVHSESVNSFQTPLFLGECRRKTFASAYQIDKFIATLFDRPPRILKRYSDCQLPMDLSDDELMAEPHVSDEARRNLTSEGWNAKGIYVHATWARLRFILGVFREEILEYPYRPPTPENDVKLKDLSTRCQQSWNTLPSHLRYTPECWDLLPPAVCLMLTTVQLAYKQSEFQILRLLEQSDHHALPSLLCVSAEIIATVLHFGTRLNRAVFLRSDFPYIVLGYGLPSAAVLTTALLNFATKPNTQPWPETLGRSVLIRQLSVFISHLENICRPGDANHDLCIKAARAISRTLDEVLDPSTPVTNVASSTVGESHTLTGRDEMSVDPIALLPSQSMLVEEDVSNMELDSFLGIDGLDLVNWEKNIDWNTTGSEWSTF